MVTRLYEKVSKLNYYKWLVLANVAVGTFMATLDGSIVNVALPTISESLNVHIQDLQWVVSAYLLTISSLLLPFGRLADIVGKRKIYSLGFLGFIIGSFLCALASGAGPLILFRIIQAAGAAMLMSNGMGIVTSVFPGRERGRALGLIGTVVAAGSMTGPSIGGLLVKHFGWSSIFFVNLPIGLLGFLASLVFLPRDVVEKRQSFDFLGALLFGAGIIILILSLSEGQDLGWTSLLIVTGLIASVIVLGLFLFWEGKAREPMVDLSLFKNRLFLAGNLAGLLSFVAMFFTSIMIPFYLKRVLHLPQDIIGFLMTPFPLAMAVIAPFSGWLSDKIGSVILTTSGMAVVTGGLIWMSTLSTATSIEGVAARLSVLGIGMGLFQSPNNSSIMGTVPPPKLGVSGGIVATVRNVGMVLGVAISVALLTNRENYYLSRIINPGEIEKTQVFLKSLSFVFMAAAVISGIGIFVAAMRGKENEKVLEERKEKIKS